MSREKNLIPDNAIGSRCSQKCFSDGGLPSDPGLLGMLVRHFANVLEVRQLTVAQDGCPKHLTLMRATGGPRPNSLVHWL